MVPEDFNRYIGQTVIIYITGGGPSGLGFKGVLLRANSAFVTLINRLGMPPADSAGGSTVLLRKNGGGGKDTGPDILTVSSMCDIPSDKIAAFRHYLV